MLAWLTLPDWEKLFVPTYALAEIFLRGTTVYLCIFAILRFLLRRQTGAIGVADLLVIVLIADAAQNALGREYDSVTEGILLILTIVGWDYFLDWLEFRFPGLRSLTRPAPTLLVRGGRLLRRNMHREMITEQELRAELRKDGVDKLEDVAEARMEGDGKISVIKAQNDPSGSSKKKTKRTA